MLEPTMESIPSFYPSALMRNLPGMAYRRENDGNWTIRFASEGARRLFGVEAWEKICTGRACLANLVHEESYEQVRKTLDQDLLQKRPYQLVYRVNSLVDPDKWVWDQGEGIFEGETLVAAEGFITDFTIHKAMEKELRDEIGRLRSPSPEESRIPGIVGQSRQMGAVFDLVEQAARCDANVIVYGASGTGKELVSRAIHDKSHRKDGAFVPVNCGAIPESLMESEFFGYRKGAFSGAACNQEGILDRADGGTLFLDEIGEIPQSMQTKLLRAIEGGGYTPVGGREVRRPDLRIIAATNRNLEDLVARGKMRSDFYYRVHVVPIRLPQLKDRRADIPLLAAHFLSRHPDAPPLGGGELTRLMSYDWPGNVRELDNVLRTYAALHHLDLPEGLASGGNGAEGWISSGGTLRERMDGVEERILREALLETGFNRTRAAKMLGIDRRSLYTKMRKYNIAGAAV